MPKPDLKRCSGILQVDNSIPGRESTISKTIYMFMEHSRKVKVIKYRCCVGNREEQDEKCDCTSKVGPEHEEYLLYLSKEFIL